MKNYKFVVVWVGNLFLDPLNFGSELFESSSDAGDFYDLQSNKGYDVQMYRTRILQEHYQGATPLWVTT